jgi:hypothetical protein
LRPGYFRRGVFERIFCGEWGVETDPEVWVRFPPASIKVVWLLGQRDPCERADR